MAQDLDDNWYCLIEELGKGSVIPVIGPEMLAVGAGAAGGKTLLYELVARELATRYQATESFAGAWSLHDCAAALLANGQTNVERLRRATASTVARLTAECAVPPALQQLAAIEAFDLYVSLSCDKLLLRALSEVDEQAKSLAFGIRSNPQDIPATARGKIAYQLLGSAENTLDFAIHEGDVLEYLFHLQSEQTRGIRNLLGRLRNGNKLFIGCRMPDWMGRSLLRAVSNDPLYSEPRATREFMTEGEGDRSLSIFVSRFSPYSLVFPGTPAEFVAELARRWREAHPTAARIPSRIPARARKQPDFACAEGPLIFVSYASENSDAAHLIAERLLALGAGDVWLDKKKLRGGDDWSQKIDEAIDTCDYFLPLLSSEADARRKGVFWEEWHTALAQANRVADTFILPTVIDPGGIDWSRYQRIGKELGSDRFRGLHLLNAPQGEFDAVAEDDLAERFDRFRRG
jgi:hypothetical protein